MEGDDINNETAEETPEVINEDNENESELAPISHEEPIPEYDEATSRDQTETVDEGNEIENTDESNSLLNDPDKTDSGTKISRSKFFSLSNADKKFFDGDSTEIRKMESASSHAYHFKRKYNFRSDSVFSDVTPMPTSSEASKTSETRDKCGSLSSLKSRESRWVSLRRKLGKVSQPNTEKAEKPKKEKTAPSTLAEKRSLLQRAKTLSMLPVNRAPKEEPAPKVKEQPPELFNVGGEMNMIPLELLIDINDLQLRK